MQLVIPDNQVNEWSQITPAHDFQSPLVGLFDLYSLNSLQVAIVPRSILDYILVAEHSQEVIIVFLLLFDFYQFFGRIELTDVRIILMLYSFDILFQRQGFMPFYFVSEIFEHRSYTNVGFPCWQMVKLIHIFINFVEVEGMRASSFLKQLSFIAIFVKNKPQILFHVLVFDFPAFEQKVIVFPNQIVLEWQIDQFHFLQFIVALQMSYCAVLSFKEIVLEPIDQVMHFLALFQKFLPYHLLTLFSQTFRTFSITSSSLLKLRVGRILMNVSCSTVLNLKRGNLKR